MLRKARRISSRRKLICLIFPGLAFFMDFARLRSSEMRPRINRRCSARSTDLLGAACLKAEFFFVEERGFFFICYSRNEERRLSPPFILPHRNGVCHQLPSEITFFGFGVGVRFTTFGASFRGSSFCCPTKPCSLSF